MKSQQNKHSKLFTTLIVLLVIGAFAAGVFLPKLFSKPKEEEPAPQYNMITNLVLDTSQENLDRGNEELASRQVFFSGINDGPVSKDGEIFLKNPESNEDIFMKYTIINDDDGEQVFETGLIASGNAVTWIPGETLPLGDYHFTFIEQPYYQVEATEGWIPLTTGNNHVNIQIVE